MKKFLLILFLVSSYLFAGNKLITISGIVTDSESKPLSYVNVYLLKSLDGSSTNEKGEFEFKTELKGTQTIIASMIGYSTFKEEIEIKDDIYLRIELQEELINMDEAVVIGSSFSSDKKKGLVVTPVDVYTTPGGAADVFQSIKSLPGLTNVSESAQLYVRGGDPNETVVLIDQAVINHPYTYESNYGGLFSNLNTGSVRNLFFSSGGFSAKYGNALSGVMEISTKDEVISDKYSLGLSMAGVNLDIEKQFGQEKLGIRVYGRQNFTKPIMWLNGEEERFKNTPTSNDIFSSVIYKYSSSGKLKFSFNTASDKTGVKVDQADFQGYFTGTTTNQNFIFNHKDLLSENFISSTSLSLSINKRNYDIGIIDITHRDKTYRLRNDSELLTKNYKVLLGFETDFRAQNFKGTLPDEEYDISKNAKSKILDETINSGHYGLYTEVESISTFGLNELNTAVGLRSDYFLKNKKFSMDYRFRASYKIGDNSTVNFSSGRFSQIPNLEYYAEEEGNPDLGLMTATHYVLSFDSKAASGDYRVEAYYKNYADLPLDDSIANYTNNGHGYAYGVDFIYKGKFWDIDGWVSYGFIKSERLWNDYEKLLTSDFDVTHNLALIAKYWLASSIQLGMNYKYSTGRPTTPIVSSQYIPDYDVYKPIYGEKNSARQKDYHRLDARLSFYNRFVNKYFLIVYLEALNILDIKNIFGYSYNEDYSERHEVKSYFGSRTLVLGAVLTIN